MLHVFVMDKYVNVTLTLKGVQELTVILILIAAVILEYVHIIILHGVKLIHQQLVPVIREFVQIVHLTLHVKANVIIVLVILDSVLMDVLHIVHVIISVLVIVLVIRFV